MEIIAFTLPMTTRVTTADESERGTQVEGVSLDSYFSSGTRIDFIKMDVQGAEYFALQGMERILRENSNVLLMIEFWPHGLREAGVDPSVLLQKTGDLGLISYRIERENLVACSKDEILQTSGDDSVNLFFSRRSWEAPGAALSDRRDNSSSAAVDGMRLPCAWKLVPHRSARTRECNMNWFAAAVVECFTRIVCGRLREKSCIACAMARGPQALPG